MAARLNRRHQDFVRDKIQATQLINRLQDHALGQVEMTATQIKAAEVVLKKSLPDLTSVDANVSGSISVHQLTDDELDRAIAQAAGQAGIAGSLAGEGAASEDP